MPPKTRKRAETTRAPAFAKTRGQRIARGGFRRVPKHVPKSLEYVQARREAEENGNAVAGNRGGVDASTAVGDVLHSLLQLCASKNTQVQLHVAAALSYPCRHEPNRERISALGGVPILLELATPRRNPAGPAMSGNPKSRISSAPLVYPFGGNGLVTV